MEYEYIYSIALDLIEKRKKNNSNFLHYSTICVMVTDKGNVFSAFNRYIMLENNQIENSCAEKEVLKIISKTNENKIKAFVVVDCSTKLPIIPCNDCKLKILDINKDNSNCWIMLHDKTFSKFYEIYAISTSENVNDITDWTEGWDSPQPDKPTYEKYTADSTNSLLIQEVNNKTFVTSSTNSNGSKMEVKTDSQSFLRKRLSKIINWKDSNITNDVKTLKKVVRQYKYTKKQLLSMAKEKKKQAKKDMQILDSCNSKI